MKNEQNPCYKCTKRKSLCQVGCKEWAQHKEKENAKKMNIDKEKARKRDYLAYQQQKKAAIERYRRYKGG